MLAYGYEWNSKEERPQILREASLVCTMEELDDLIHMLQDFRAGQPQEQDGDHRHFRDWSESWSKLSSDFIIFISDKPWTKETD